MKAGGAGIDNAPTPKLELSIRTIVDIEGLSFMSSWTHNKARCMHFVISPFEYVSLSVESMKSFDLPSFQHLHPCQFCTLEWKSHLIYLMFVFKRQF